MNRLPLSSLVVAVSLMILPATQARAASIAVGDSQLWVYDGTSVGCSTCSADVIFELLTGTSLKISFENTSTDGLAGINILTGIGFNTTPDLTEVTLDSQSIEGGKIWQLGSGVGGGTWEIGMVTTQGINNGLDNQSDAADSGWILLTWSNPLIGLLGLNIDGSVTKFQGVGPGGELSVQAPGNPVPEPGTLLLLGGGIALAAHRRRRQLRLQSR